ncbi:MAG: ABC transporter ATP-binding protein/permease [Clostridia bacterium]|nr:ABC transporter ATP-binding protein/permease [Clostridia bacterium]
MLELKNITKVYDLGDNSVEALKGIDVSFRKNEFVSVLGPSGCGKTTLLNIIGGLDVYTNGDLFINGKSTKKYKDRDWDYYRNHSIGFVFQNYNLIPHQNVLSNVELALTLSGVSKAERRKRATEALKKVGLGDQLHKKPNQMSGGQMQRVAIARALVNDPDILLADEPTGALDSETSVQIMEILKDISKDKLIIMVTHNPELADKYSSRIIRLLDGKMTDDTSPYDGEADAVVEEQPEKIKKSKKKTSMSFFTALSLSLNNLMTKKARTFLTSFAGSIGIIGIALILAVSNGVQTYIDTVQEDTLSSYPLTIESETVDLSTLMETLSVDNLENTKHELDAVYSNSVMYELLNSMNNLDTQKNNLTAFKEFLDNKDNEITKYISALSYGYDLDMNIYAKDEDGKIIKSDIEEMMKNVMGIEDNINEDSDTQENGMYSAMSSSSYLSRFSTINVWQEMLPGDGKELLNPLVKQQYDVLYGEWPQKYNEIVLVVDKNNEVSDMCLYALGLKSSEEMEKVYSAYFKGDELDVQEQSWSYKDICNMTFRLVLPANYYRYDAKTGTYVDFSGTDAGLKYLYDNGIELKICGIIRPNEDAISASVSGSIGYTSALTNYVIEQAESTDAVKAQLEDSSIDVFTALPFKTDDYEEPTNEQKAKDIKEYLENLSNSELADIYKEVASTADDDFLNTQADEAMKDMSREYIEDMLSESYAQEMGIEKEELDAYIADMDDETLMAYVREIIIKQIAEEYAQKTLESLEFMSSEQLAYAFRSELEGYDDIKLANLYDNYMPATVSEATLEENYKKLGIIDKNKPASINIYASTFENKDMISSEIEKYNNSVDEDDKINYTDYIAIIMSSVTTIINAISYVLILFVGISLVVSSIMIGIITYISVLERTKEIGILRSIGASKRDISRVFNAETVIIGFTAGAIGIILTILLCIPINMIVHSVTGIYTINAVLPYQGAIALVLISVLLTVVAGLFPSRVAAKKDPVVALRSE